MSLTTYEVAVILRLINIRCSRLDDVLILDQFSIIRVHISITFAVSNYIVNLRRLQILLKNMVMWTYDTKFT